MPDKLGKWGQRLQGGGTGGQLRSSADLLDRVWSSRLPTVENGLHSLFQGSGGEEVVGMEVREGAVGGGSRRQRLIGSGLTWKI